MDESLQMRKKENKENYVKREYTFQLQWLYNKT